MTQIWSDMAPVWAFEGGESHTGGSTSFRWIDELPAGSQLAAGSVDFGTARAPHGGVCAPVVEGVAEGVDPVEWGPAGEIARRGVEGDQVDVGAQ